MGVGHQVPGSLRPRLSSVLNLTRPHCWEFGTETFPLVHLLPCAALSPVPSCRVGVMGLFWGTGTSLSRVESFLEVREWTAAGDPEMARPASLV